jgi:type IV secretory pathway TraG/TraD family ATPase VirD4
MHWTHGSPGFLITLCVTAAGVLFGLIRGHARFKSYLELPLLVLLAFGVVLLVVNLIALIPIHLGEFLSASLSLACFAFFGTMMGLGRADTDRLNSDHKRGTILSPFVLTRKNRDRKSLTVAGHPVDPADETKHFKLIGTTGTGKSTAIQELLHGALERGDRAVIADPDGSYLDRFYDRGRGDLILNPFDSRAARWDLFAEMQTLFDADQLALSLIADTEGTERPWRGYARVFLTSVLRQLHRVKHDDVAELYRLLTTTPPDDLRELLADTPAAAYLAQDNGKFFGAVRAVANTHLGGLEHIALQPAGDKLCVREWVRKGEGNRGRILFLPYRANEIATLRSLISTWMRLAIFETMSPRQGADHSDQKLWFIIDELDALGAIDGLKDALARLRKFGGRCILGFQSIAQVSGTYGHAEAQTIVENCGNSLILRCSASEGGGTARFASHLIGEREVMRKQVTTNRDAGIILHVPRSSSTSLQQITESAVLPSEIEQLPDLHGYLKLASQPEWRRVKIAAPMRPFTANANTH